MYKFYTAEMPPEYNFERAHIGKVKCIQWLDDDSGFISGGYDANIFLWKLHVDPIQSREQKETNPVFEYKQKNVIFSCVAYKPDTKYSIYAVGTDKSLKEIESGKEKYPRYESNVNIS